ncbi:MAG: 2-oxo acid dehydrogenase subunit E2 [Polyangiaceae bacterium]|nr:2-oxo acid dehydrogenase subunit E2 [Polyangiaceae bacterium]
MAKILNMPKLSPTMEEGVLVAWHKNEGDSVDIDDLLAEVETDKATMEFRSFDKGTLLKILVQAGESVKLGQAVAALGNAGENVTELIAQAAAPAPARTTSPTLPVPSPAPGAAAPAPVVVAPPPQVPFQPVSRGSLLTRTEREAADAESADTEAGAADATGATGQVLASPYVRKVARERGIDLTGAHGTGVHGRIVPADLDSLATRPPSSDSAGHAGAAVAQGAHAPAPTPASLAAPEVRPLSPMRKTIARRLANSKASVPHFYLTIDVDAEALVALRELINGQLAEVGKNTNQKKASDEAKPLKVSLNDLLVKAVAAALVRVPECNAQFDDNAILVHRRVDISVAVAIPDGLVTPVVRNADQKSVVAIASEIRDLASRARAKKLSPKEMSDGTFSISNLGMFGIDEFSAVINPPEGGILAVGRVRHEPVVKDSAVVPGKKIAMTLSCDHRVIDGAAGAAFLAELRSLIEHPMRILTG